MAATVHAPGRVASGAESAGERIGDVAHPVIEVTSLHKAYGATIAVQDVSFTVSEGEIFGILGPNGAGKTTTVECMSGLRVADGGTIGVLGLDPQRDRHAIRELVGGSAAGGFDAIEADGERAGAAVRIVLRESSGRFGAARAARPDRQA